MRVLITGAGGFLGQELAAAFLADPRTTDLVLTDIDAPPIPQSTPPRQQPLQPHCLAADLTRPDDRDRLLSTPFDAIYLLHGIMSSGSESNLDLGLLVNLDSTRALLDALRSSSHHRTTKLIFTSSTAVYGAQDPSAPTSEATCPVPQSSYGAQKLIVETLLNDFSRRGLLDARICRLPTVVVRPGKPTAAASSFASGILREPLQGQSAVLPVPRDLKIWICSPRTVVANLVRAAELPKEKYAKYKSRTVNLPGRTVTVQQMLDALEAVGGREARGLVSEERDQAIYDIVVSWPDTFDTARAEELGFARDQELEATVRDFWEGHVKKGGE